MLKNVIEMMQGLPDDDNKAAENAVLETVEAAEVAVTEGAEEKEAAETPENRVERPYTLRNLKDRDLFPLLKILCKIGLKEFKGAFDQFLGDNAEGESESVQSIGVSVLLDIAGTIVEHIGAVEDDLYNLYSDMSGKSKEEIQEMEFGTLPLMILDSFSEVKNTSFFKVLSRLL